MLYIGVVFSFMGLLSLEIFFDDFEEKDFCRYQIRFYHKTFCQIVSMKTSGSCHLVINRNPMMIVGTFVTLQMLVFLWGGTSTPFLKWTPSTNTNVSSRYHAHFGKTLDIFPANISIFTVHVSNLC